MVKNLPGVQESKVQAPGKKDTPEKGIASHSIILAWIMVWTEESGRLQFMGSQTVGYN